MIIIIMLCTFLLLDDDEGGFWIESMFLLLLSGRVVVTMVAGRFTISCVLRFCLVAARSGCLERFTLLAGDNKVEFLLIVGFFLIVLSTDTCPYMPRFAEAFLRGCISGNKMAGCEDGSATFSFLATVGALRFVSNFQKESFGVRFNFAH